MQEALWGWRGSILKEGPLVGGSSHTVSTYIVFRALAQVEG